MYTCKLMLVGSAEEISRPLPPNNDTWFMLSIEVIVILLWWFSLDAFR